MSDKELQEAIERYRRFKRGNFMWRDDIGYYADADPIISAYIADLDRREAEEAKRALPHSPEWLVSIGGLPDGEPNNNEIFFKLYHLEPADRGSFVAGEHIHVGFCPDGSAWVECYDEDGNSKEVIMIGYFKTRGQVLDLLRALGCDVKEQPK